MKYKYLTGRSIMPDGKKSTKLTCFECGEPQLSSNHTVDNKNICHSCKRKDEEGLLEIDTKINLCDDCIFSIAECRAKPEDVTYGDGIGNDNIIKCSKQVKPW